MGKITLSKPEVFIIESLRFDDERQDRFEGQIIKKILALSGKTCEYYYIRTKRELARVLQLFTESRYRYLHLSCHGGETSMATTLDAIAFPELATLLRPHLKSRRLFVSACAMTNAALARKIMPGSGCFSILGPGEDIGFADAAILWASLYHIMFAADATAMTREGLKARAQAVANMFGVRLKYFGQASGTAGYVERAIGPEGVA